MALHPELIGFEGRRVKVIPPIKGRTAFYVGQRDGVHILITYGAMGCVTELAGNEPLRVVAVYSGGRIFPHKRGT